MLLLISFIRMNRIEKSGFMIYFVKKIGTMTALIHEKMDFVRFKVK